MEESPLSLEAIRECLKEKNNDSGTEIDQEGDMKKVKLDPDDPLNTAIIKPNLDSIRKILGGDGTDQQRKVVEENTGLIPKYYKPYKLLESTESGKPVSLYKCDFCHQVYRGHNSIVYHCRRHIGDYPYRCEDCGFVEVCKSGLSSHMNRTGHGNCRKIDAQPSPGQNGTGSTLNSTQITRKAKKVDAYERGKHFVRGKRVSMEPAETILEEGFTSPAKKAKTQIEKIDIDQFQENNFWRQRNNNSNSEKAMKSFGNMSDNFKLSETLRKLNQISNDDSVSKYFSNFPNFSNDDAFGKMKMTQKSWYLLGGKGVPKDEPDDDACIFVDSFQSKVKRESKPSTQKASCTGKPYTAEPDDINVDQNYQNIIQNGKKLAPCEEAQHWKFCKKCQTGWYKSEKVFFSHSCFNVTCR